MFIDEKEFGKSRDALYFELQEHNIFGRRYFYPLISSFLPYRDYPSAKVENLPVANKIANEVLCLSMHHELEEEEITMIIELIRH